MKIPDPKTKTAFIAVVGVSLDRFMQPKNVVQEAMEVLFIQNNLTTQYIIKCICIYRGSTHFASYFSYLV